MSVINGINDWRVEEAIHYLKLFQRAEARLEETRKLLDDYVSNLSGRDLSEYTRRTADLDNILGPSMEWQE